MLYRLCLIFFALSGCLADVTRETPPSEVVLIFPTGEIVTGSNLTFGVAEGALINNETYYGLARDYSVEMRFPNGTEVALGGFSDYALGHCGSRAAHVSWQTPDDFRPPLAGQYTALWNVTYGTLPNTRDVPRVFDHCNFSGYTNQSWAFSVPIDVVSITGDVSEHQHPAILFSSTTTAFSDQPTGSYLVDTSSGQDNGDLAMAKQSARAFVGVVVISSVLMLIL